MPRLRCFVVSLLATTVACGESVAPPPQSGLVAIVGARLIDGTGTNPIPDSVVVIQDDRIVAAGRRSDTAVPDGASVVDGVGKTVIPGLVDTHAHYHGDLARVEQQYRTQLYFGVTASRSIGSDPPEKVAKAFEARTGKIPGPRMYTAGLGFSYPDGFPPGLPVNRPATEDEARSLVADLAGQGVDFVKMWVNEMSEPGFKIRPEMRAAIVDEALNRDIVPVAHISEEADVRQLIEAGVKDFLHTVTDTDVGLEFIQLCLDSDITFSPTLTNIQAAWNWAERPDLLEDPEIRAAFEPEALTRWTDRTVRQSALADPGLADRKARLRHAMEFVKKITEAGIPVAVGTDSGASSWNVPMGWGTHRELQLFVQAGLTPMQAIVAATRNGAELLSGGQSDYGTLQPGKIADLVVLTADPLEDITNTLQIDRVMQGGRWLDRSQLLPVRSGVAGSSTAACEPDGEVQFLCGPVSPEDLAPIPQSPLVIVSSMVDEGRLYLADTRDHTSTVLFPTDTLRPRHDTATYGECPGPVTGQFRPHGLYLQPSADALHTLYVVGHGAREAIEVFEVDATGTLPAVTWIGCAVAPEALGLNSVVALPDGGFAATSPRTGDVWQWQTGAGWSLVPGTEDIGPNGLEISRDGQWFYVGGYGRQSLIRLSRGQTPVVQDAVEVGFHIDNVRWGPGDTLLAAGHVGRTREAIGACIRDRQCDGVTSRVALVDLATFTAEEVVHYPSNQLLVLGTVAIQVGDEIWVGGVAGGDRIARFPAP